MDIIITSNDIDKSVNDITKLDINIHFNGCIPNFTKRIIFINFKESKVKIMIQNERNEDILSLNEFMDDYINLLTRENYTF